MKKRLLSILMICALSCSVNLHAQCTPNNSITTTGTFPTVLDSAKVGVLYQQVIQFHITKDTTVFVPQLGQTLNATIDTLRITAVNGMPDGFTYSCHNADCKIVGGTTGCAKLTGTPLPGSAGIYPLLVLINIRATAMVGSFPVAQTVSDTNARYAIVVQPGTGTTEWLADQQVILYPNPAKGELQVYVSELHGPATFSIRNIEGKILRHGDLLGNKEVNKLNMDQIAPGIYFIEILAENKTWMKKFVIE